MGLKLMLYGVLMWFYVEVYLKQNEIFKDMMTQSDKPK